MNSRFFSIVLIATLVSVSSGCSGIRNCLFGRGARCGLCNRMGDGIPAPQFGNTMQAPCQAPACGQPRAGQPPMWNPQAQGPAPYTCGSCGSPVSGDCGCGFVDPYVSGGNMVVPPGGSVVPPIQGDDFSARRFDNDGSRIIWEEPTYGGTSL